MTDAVKEKTHDDVINEEIEQEHETMSHDDVINKEIEQEHEEMRQNN